MQNSPDLFPSYLQRHSLHTRLKDIAPLARGTSSALRANQVDNNIIKLDNEALEKIMLIRCKFTQFNLPVFTLVPTLTGAKAFTEAQARAKMAAEIFILLLLLEYWLYE